MQLRLQGRRRWLAAAVCCCVPALPLVLAQQAAPLRIALEARKFTFSQTEIHLKRGVPVTLVLTATDFVHGVSIPDFGVRVDTIPGKITEVSFTPDKAGKFHFLCDNFCGEGHDQMSGFLIVT